MSIFEDTKLSTLVRRPTVIRSAMAFDEAVVVAAAAVADGSIVGHAEVFVEHRTFLHMHHSLVAYTGRTHSHRIHPVERGIRYAHMGQFRRDLVYVFVVGVHNHTPLDIR